MMIGPSFASELAAAGLGGLPISWTALGEIEGRGALSVEQNATLDAVIAAHDPDTPLPSVPVEVEPVRIACALRVPVIDDEVQQIGGSFRVTAMVLIDVGTFLVIFSQPLGSAEPYVIPNNGVSISIAEWGEDYAVIEVRDHAGGSLITPASFGFSLYQL